MTAEEWHGRSASESHGSLDKEFGRLLLGLVPLPPELRAPEVPQYQPYPDRLSRQASLRIGATATSLEVLRWSPNDGDADMGKVVPIRQPKTPPKQGSEALPLPLPAAA